MNTYNNIGFTHVWLNKHVLPFNSFLIFREHIFVTMRQMFRYVVLSTHLQGISAHWMCYLILMLLRFTVLIQVVTENLYRHMKNLNLFHLNGENHTFLVANIWESCATIKALIWLCLSLYQANSKLSVREYASNYVQLIKFAKLIVFYS